MTFMNIAMLHSRIAPLKVSTLVQLLIITLLCGCSVAEGKDRVGGVKDRLSNLSKSANDIELVKKFPLDEVPHTLMRKPVAEGVLTSGHGYRLSPTGIPLPRKHKGVDYGADSGIAVYAAGSGTIEKLYVSRSFGKTITIQHQNGFSTLYAHMDSFAEGLKTGMEVSRAQKIGTVGSTGQSSGPHLHFELHYGGKSIDPVFTYNQMMKALKRSPPAVATNIQNW